MNEAVSIAIGEAFSRIIDWARVGISGLVERHKIAELIEETASRASTLFPSSDLGDRFRDVHLIEELLAHRKLMDIDKDDSIGIFLGDNTDDEAKALVEDFYTEVNRILSSPEGSLASRKASENTEEILRLMKGTRAEEQVPLLEELVRLIEDDSIDVDRIHELSKSSYDSAASKYLGAYYALCTDGDTNLTAIDWLKGNDVLVEALCSVTVSAGRQDVIAGLTSLFSFDATSIASAMNKTASGSYQMGETVNVQVPEGKSIDGLIGLINFEYLSGFEAYHAAIQHANRSAVTWNPLAREKLAAAKLANSAVFKSKDLETLAIEYASRYRAWFPQKIRHLYEQTMALVLMALEEPSARHVLACVPNELSEFVEGGAKKLEIRVCNDAREALGLVAWAESRKDPEFLIYAAGKAIELDAGARDYVISTFEKNQEWAFPTPEALHYYSKEINPDISYKRFIDWGGEFNDLARFHLSAYDKFKDAYPNEVKQHIERALELMRSPTGTPELLYSFIWVPYLVANGREDEVLEIAGELLPLVPIDFLLPFLKTVARESEDLLNRVFDSIASAEFEDPASAEVVSTHLESKGEVEVAGRIAAKAFRKQPSDRLAETAVWWMLSSAIDIDQSIIRYAEERDNCRMNLLLANIEHETGSPQKQNSLLLRAAFRDDPESHRALFLYAVWNAGGGNEPKTLHKVCDNASVKVKTSNDETVTLFFLSDIHAIKEEGATGPAGIAYSTASGMYMRFRGRKAGETVAYEDTQAVIESIKDAENALIAAGFAELPNMPGSTVITGDVNEMISKLTELMASNKGKELLSKYINGIETNGETLYFGIDAGRLFAPTRQLEFTIEAVTDPAMPYRRMPTCTNAANRKDAKFILSRSAIVVLSLLDMPPEAADSFLTRCVVTSSTARKLCKEAKELADEICDGDGRLSFNGTQPFYIEFGEEAKREAAEKALSIIGLVDKLEKVDPVTECPDIKLLKALSDNSAIDVQTALEGNFVFVTEDLIEARLIEAFGLPKRCSLTALLLYSGLIKFVFGEYAQKMIGWGAYPPIEDDVLNALQRTLAGIDKDPRAANRHPE